MKYLCLKQVSYPFRDFGFYFIQWHQVIDIGEVGRYFVLRQLRLQQSAFAIDEENARNGFQ